MIVYNITINIAPGIETEWLNWQKEEHIPEVMASGLFTDYKFYRLLEPQQDDSVTYVVQYFASSPENYHSYINEKAPLLRQKAINKWGDQFIVFRTVMQVVN